MSARTFAHPTDLLVDGRRIPGEGAGLTVDDPATGEVIARLPTATRAQVLAAADAADTAFGAWSALAPQQRSAALHRLADTLEARRDLLVRTIVAEAGTPVTLSRMLQVDAPLRHLRWYADRAAVDRTEPLGVDELAPRSESVIAHRPVGPVAALTAYNYPLLLAISKAGAALAAGCTVVLLPSPLAPLTTLLVADAAQEAGLPAGVLNVVVAGREESAALTLAPGIAKISFTGSLEVGRQVMRQAAQNVRGVVLELGGKSPNLLLPGVDLAAITEAVHLRYLRNAGQGCASPTRLLVHRSQYDEFLERSSRVVAEVPVGDPWDETTVVGPVISAAHRDRVEGMVADAADAGAEVIARGSVPPSIAERGYWVAPALVGGVPSTAPIAQEEIFGPVGVVLPYGDLDEAVALANGTVYGLAANVYGDLEMARTVTPRLQAGLVTLNGGGALRPDGSFGGFKSSGIGREHGEGGIREFLEPQHVQWPA